MAKEKKTEKSDVFHYLRIAVLVIFLVFLVLASYFGFLFGRMVFTDDARTDRKNAVSYEIILSPEKNAFQIGMELEQNGIIESGAAFYLQTKLYSCKLPTGIYELSSGMSSKAIAKYLNQEYIVKHQEQ